MKIIRYFFYLIGISLAAAILYLAITFPPIMAGMAAKTMCSCVFVMGRTPESVVQKELSVFPGLSKAGIEFKDSSAVTARVLWSVSKAIYRKGQGCTLLAERSEQEVRQQSPALPTLPPLNADTVAWPNGDLVSTPPVAGLNYDAVQAALRLAFEETNPEQPKNTHAVLAIYDGQIIGEQYASGFDKHTLFMGWSMTKSLNNAMVALMVKEGKLNPDAPAPVAAWQNDERKNITLSDLLHGSSGLAWDESYFLPGDFHNMFMHSDDKGGFAASKELEYPPNTFFEYSSGTANLLSKITREAVGDENYPRFAYDKLFHKIGMRHTLIEPDASGTLVGSSYGYASARDWGRFGLLFLQDGIWNGERILPEGWVKYSSTPAPAAPIGQYGAQFWLNAGAPNDPNHCYHPGLPNEEYGAEGFEDQYVFIFPSRKLIVVRLGVSHHGFDIVGLCNQILDALPKP
jgi:CubicO group peptidase (beta-lactamase class C family)